MWIALAAAGAIVLAALAYLATLEGDFRVRREQEIDAPLDEVFAAVVDLRRWPEWSPWLLHEADARLTYSEDCRDEGGYFDWDGRLVGAGRITHTAIRPGSAIEQRIEFARPFRSTAEVNWRFEPADGKTRVGWEMIGRMPFLLRFMTRGMERTIGRDYELGLALLGGSVNPQAPHPRIEFDGKDRLDDFAYWAIPFRGNLRQLENARRPSIDALENAAAGKAGLPLVIYRDLDPLARTYSAEISLPVADTAPASNYSRRQFTGGTYFRATLQGAHGYLPLGWHALFSHCRLHKIRVDRSRPALEIYLDDPRRTEDANRIRTALYLATR